MGTNFAASETLRRQPQLNVTLFLSLDDFNIFPLLLSVQAVRG
jgi:hypothetical protein